MIKKWYKKFRRNLLSLFNLFYIPYLFAFCRKKLNPLATERQIFLMTRMDFGTFLYVLHYASSWDKLRGKTCLVILTPRYKEVEALAKHLTPDTLLISPPHFMLRLAIKVFGKHNIHEHTLFPVHSLLKGAYPHSLHLFDSTARASYIPFFDRRLKEIPASISKAFLHAYCDIRKYLNFREETMLDYFHVHHKCGLSRRHYATEALNRLKKELNIGERYVVFNLNCKTYKEKGTDRKRILHPKRYEVVIDLLIEKGFTVVIQGREEQPRFNQRKGLIDYAKSPLTSIENDLALYSGSQFAIVNKTGPESFCALCNTPQLGLNFSELITLTPHVKSRFFPKRIQNRRSGKDLTWQEYLLSPSFFDISNHIYDPDIAYFDIETEEMVEALEEFIPLVDRSEEKWLEYTHLQKEYKRMLHPLHLDLYDVKSVPCDAYLKKSMKLSKSPKSQPALLG